MSEQKKKYHIETLAVHAGQEVPESDTKARNVPVYLSIGLEHEDDIIAALEEGLAQI